VGAHRCQSRRAYGAQKKIGRPVLDDPGETEGVGRSFTGSETTLVSRRLKHFSPGRGHDRAAAGSAKLDLVEPKVGAAA
jgi:hypothetical protein